MSFFWCFLWGFFCSFFWFFFSVAGFFGNFVMPKKPATEKKPKEAAKEAPKEAPKETHVAATTATTAAKTKPKAAKVKAPKKARGPKKVAAHPPFKIMIARAIIADKNRKGSSRAYIKKYLQQNYKIDPKSSALRIAIARLSAMKDGARLVANHQHKGHYRISDQLKREIKQMDNPKKKSKKAKKAKKTRKPRKTAKRVRVITSKKSPKKAKKAKKTTKKSSFSKKKQRKLPQRKQPRR